MKPLLCKAEVVRALLNNTVGSWPAKPIDPSKPTQWQDRRLGKIQDDTMTELGVDFIGHQTKGIEVVATYRAFPGKGTARWGICASPYKPGDILYVREKFGLTCNVNDQKEWLDGIPHIPSSQFPSKAFQNRSADALIWAATSGAFEWFDEDGGYTEKSFWKPSLHMPKWASRIHLEVLRVRVERACDISEEDAIAEGMIDDSGISARGLFRHVWEKLYGLDAWQRWIWCYDLKRIK